MAAVLKRQSEAGEALVFAVAGEEYAVDILRVREIRGYEKVTPLPSAPAHLKGVVNLRGTIVPIVDMRVKLGAPATYDASTVAVILSVGERLLGLVVDSVSDVLDIPAGELRTAPEMGSMVDCSFIRGVATLDGRMILVIDMDKYLSMDLLAAPEHIAVT